MKKILVIIFALIPSVAGCKNSGGVKDLYYVYSQGKTLNLPQAGSKFYILESIGDSDNLVITDKNTYTPTNTAMGFIGFYEKSDSTVKFWGIDTTKVNAPLNIALSYFRHFYSLPASLFSVIRNSQSPIAIYIMFQSDSINPEKLYDFAMRSYVNRDTLTETETYYLIKIMYEIKRGTQKDLPILDSLINFYLSKWPYGKNSPRVYYYLLSSGKIRQDTMLNIYKNLLLKHPSDEYALQFVAFLADTSIKGNKNKKYLKEFLETVKKLPVTSVTLQLTYYIPEIFDYIDANDTSNIFKRNLINSFGSPPYLVRLWSTSTLIGYHFAKGYFLKRNKKYEQAISEFQKCDNYDIPHYYKEEKDRQIIDIYKLTGKYDSEECKKVALDLLSKNPADTVGKNVLNNPPEDSLFSLLKPILEQKEQPVNPQVKFKLLKGGTLSSNDLKGKAWIIKFWSVYCPHCRKEIPFENELYLELKDNKNFGFLGCSTNSKEEVQKFLDKNAFYFTQAYECNTARKFFGVSGVPAYFVLDKNANIVFSHIGEDPNIKNRLKTELFMASKL